MTNRELGKTLNSDIAPDACGTQSPDRGITVFYDGSCALCRREIGFVRALDGLDCATFSDISALPADSDVAPGVRAGTAMKRMHVRLADGRMVQGAAAFAAMWGASRRLRFLSRFIGSPAAIKVLDKVYDVVLIVRPPLSRAVGRFDAWRAGRRGG